MKKTLYNLNTFEKIENAMISLNGKYISINDEKKFSKEGEGGYTNLEHSIEYIEKSTAVDPILKKISDLLNQVKPNSFSIYGNGYYGDYILIDWNENTLIFNYIKQYSLFKQGKENNWENIEKFFE